MSFTISDKRGSIWSSSLSDLEEHIIIHQKSNDIELRQKSVGEVGGGRLIALINNTGINVLIEIEIIDSDFYVYVDNVLQWSNNADSGASQVVGNSIFYNGNDDSWYVVGTMIPNPCEWDIELFTNSSSHSVS